MPNEKDKKEEEGELGIMKAGDYMIHVFVEGGKNFVVKDADAKTFDALLKLSCGTLSQHSQTLSDCVLKSDQPRYWGEHFFFEPTGLSSEDVASQVITVQLLDKGFLRDSQVGIFDIDLSQIYFEQEDHAIHNQWVALSNPESADKNAIVGYLQLSISIQGPGDNAVRLQESDGQDDTSKDVLMPASIRKDQKQLEVTIMQAEHLPKMDMIGTIDAYVSAAFQKQKYKTKTVNPSSGVCTFDQVFMIPLQWPATTDRLVLGVWDEERAAADEAVGVVVLSLKEIAQSCSTADGEFRWLSVYGAHTGLSQGPNMKRMNGDPEFASCWKGSLLVHLRLSDSKAPERGVQKCKPDLRRLTVERGLTAQQEYQVQFEVGAGICLPGNEKYKVRLSIGRFNIDSDSPKELKKAYCRWSQRIENKGFTSRSQSLNELERVYVYLMRGDKAICYWRGAASDFVDRNPTYRWLPLVCDQGVGEVKEPHRAGMLQIKLSINDLKSNPMVNWSQYPNWSMPPPKDFKTYTLRCFLFQCRDLPPADKEGTSDVYVKVWNPEGQAVQTKVVEDNLNPIFYETKEIRVEVNEQDLGSTPPVVLHFYDRDDDLLNLDDDDYLGTATIKLSEASIVIQDKKKRGQERELNSVPKPRWHDVRGGLKEDLPARGQILCSFVLVESFGFGTPAAGVKIGDEVATRDYTVNINVLGLRDLQSFGLLPIKKAFIQFNVRSLLPPEKSFAVTNIKTAPKSPGQNPNINEMISFSTQLPVDKLYCPKLACDVYDQIFKGLCQPQVGSFVIDVGAIMHEQIVMRQELQKHADQCIAKLQAKIDTSAEFDGEIAEHESLRSSQMNYALALGYDAAETISAFSRGPGLGKRKKKKKKGGAKPRKNNVQQLVKEIMEINDLEEGKPQLTTLQQITEDPYEQATETFIDRERDPTLMIEEEDYGDETSLLLQQDGQIDSSLVVGQRRTAAPMFAQTEDNLKNLQRLVELSIQDKFKGKRVMAMQQLELLSRRAQEGDKAAGGELQAQLDELLGAVQTQTEDERKKKAELQSLKQQILSELHAGREKQKQDRKQRNAAKKRADLLSLLAAGVPAHKNVLMPQYVKDERLKVYREVASPPESLYMPIGYDGAVTDQKPTAGKRHYRKFYMDELENNREIFKKSVFYEAPVMRGQPRGIAQGFLATIFRSSSNLDGSSQLMTMKQVGRFKGHIVISNDEEKKREKEAMTAKSDQLFGMLDTLHLKVHGKKLSLTRKDLESSENKHKLKRALMDLDLHSDLMMDSLLYQNEFDRLAELLSVRQSCVVRLYVLEGFDLASRDIGSASDPYLKITCGAFKYNGKDKYLLDEPNPQFNESFEFNVSFPGASPLVIEAFDYDDLFGDDLIGRTVIDLDERQYCQNWKEITDKPIESRELYHESSRASQGSLICWLDILDTAKSKSVPEKWDITPEPNEDYQLRVAVYEATNVPREDVEGTSDVFVSVTLGDQEAMETDTHWRCSTGTASFNYRLLFDFAAPGPSKNRANANIMRVQLFDRDLFKSNDFLCEFAIDLTLLVQDCRWTHKPIHLSKKYYDSYFKEEYSADKGHPQLEVRFEDEDSFWLSVKRDEDKKPIQIRLDLRVLPGKAAKSQAVGSARAAPNHSPELREPVGRFKFSLNPLDMLGQLIGPELKAKCMAYLGVILCTVILFLCLPMIFSDIISKLFLKLFGL